MVLKHCLTCCLLISWCNNIAILEEILHTKATNDTAILSEKLVPLNYCIENGFGS